MSFTIIKGSFLVDEGIPQGDSVRFMVDAVALDDSTGIDGVWVVAERCSERLKSVLKEQSQ
ncbi:hypothetical protein QWZ03_16080 [Chitinimonas viridis]|uniref:Uncharacterized protein n=1 Tax=Chitinimonas viridis TaxID=664880 RepID=A0ABT8B7Q2_9NEIS|nr:hypothetical protein [Chitinimonas viridis]MDN3578288.1 hypothetical protein [Chitinimonas viridis]